jgi:hypothetical protein
MRSTPFLAPYGFLLAFWVQMRDLLVSRIDGQNLTTDGRGFHHDDTWLQSLCVDTDYTAAGSRRRLARFVHGDHEFFGAATEKARPKPGFGLKLAS